MNCHVPKIGWAGPVLYTGVTGKRWDPFTGVPAWKATIFRLVGVSSRRLTGTRSLACAVRWECRRAAGNQPRPGEAVDRHVSRRAPARSTILLA